MSEREQAEGLQDDRVLVLQARRGDKAAIRTLIDLHKERLYAFVWRFVRNHHDAEEVCQDAFLKAFAALDSYNGQFRFSTWLFTIGYRVCLNNLRRKRTVNCEATLENLRIPATDGLAEVSESEETARVRTLVWQAVDQLSPPQRAAVLLFYKHEQGCHEIARVLDVPVATVKSHLHRARARLRDLLSGVSETELLSVRNLAG